MTNHARIACLGCSILLTGISTAGADPVRVDQSLRPGSGAHSSVFGDVVQAQTFTVGLTGTLAALDLFLSANGDRGDLLIDIRPTIDGIPVESHEAALASATISASVVTSPTPTAPGTVHVDFSQFAVPVTAGDVLAFALRSPDSTRARGEYSVSGNTTGYPRGDHFTLSPSFGYPVMTRIGLLDLSFRTYVAQAPALVPEPGSMLLLGTGLLGCAGALRNRRLRRAAQGQEGSPS